MSNKKEVEAPEPEVVEEEGERYYIIKELHLHNCQGVVILQQGQAPPPPRPPHG